MVAAADVAQRDWRDLHPGGGNAGLLSYRQDCRALRRTGLLAEDDGLAADGGAMN